MATNRRFCRFSRSESTRAFGMPEVPEDGLCLSAFVVLSPRDTPEKVLMGRIDPTAPWDHVGALDPSRVAAWKDRWMLPSSHLLLQEAPAEAAARILLEQVGLGPRSLLGPTVSSEVYTPERHPTARRHWDLEFIFRGTVEEAELRPVPVWTELRFVEVGAVVPSDIARGQADILERVGIHVGAAVGRTG